MRVPTRRWRKFVVPGFLAACGLMAALSANHPRFKSLSQQKATFARDYADQIESLQKSFPELAVAGGVGLHGAASDMFIGWRDYYASGDRDRHRPTRR
mgnify:CR=1 FL=1